MSSIFSAVPQGSISGLSLIALFINDVSSGLSPGTKIVSYLYVDDAEIWREMVDEVDFNTIQRNII